MTVRVAAAVQAHPLRVVMARALADEVGGEVVLDPDPDGPRSPWRTYRRALESTPAWATHRLIVQDDATACPGFARAALAALEARPDRLVAFFVAGQPFDHRDAIWAACDRGDPWAELRNDRWCPVVALAWPARMVWAALEFVDRSTFPPEWTADDEIVGRYLRDAGESACATAPSLIQHLDEVASVKSPRRGWRGKAPGRVAAVYVGDCGCDALEIDW